MKHIIKVLEYEMDRLKMELEEDQMRYSRTGTYPSGKHHEREQWLIELKEGLKLLRNCFKKNKIPKKKLSKMQYINDIELSKGIEFIIDDSDNELKEFMKFV